MAEGCRILFVTFSLYSVVPVPARRVRKENMPFVMCCFPLVGALIGAVFYGWFYVCGRFSFGDLTRTLFAVSLPLLLSGGIHADGYLDTSDALHAFGEKEERQRILKDPHIGAFAVISFAAWLLVFAAAVSLVPVSYAFSAAMCFVLSRCLSALAVLSFPTAKPDGMLSDIAAGGKKKKARCLTAAVTAFAIALTLGAALIPGIFSVLLMAAVFLHYRHTAEKKFGGNSGDLAGWFLLRAECAGMWAVALCGVFM